jgi:hypothetical protein
MAFLDTSGEGQDLVLFDSFLKEWYMAKWIDLLNNLTTTYKLFRRRIVPFKGRRMVIALRTSRSGAVEAVPLSGYNSVGLAGGTPTTVVPGYQGTDNAHVRPKVLMCGIGVPQDVVDVSSSEKGAFYDVIDFEMMGIKTDCANYQDLLCYMGGRELGHIDTVNGQGDFDVSNVAPYHINKRLHVTDSGGSGSGYDEDEEINYVGATSHTVVDGVTRSTRNITVSPDGDGSPAIAAGDQLWTKGSRSFSGSATNATSFEPLGLQEIVSASNLTLSNYEGNQLYLNRTRTGQSDWQSVVESTHAALTFEKMQTMIDDIHDNSGGEPTVILTTRRVRREYAKKCAFTNGVESGAANLRFVGTTKYKQGLVSFQEDSHYAGGNDYMYFDERIPIIVDRYATQDDGANDGFMYFIDTRHMYYALVTDWKWWAPEGRILREANNNVFGVVAHAYILGELVCDAPNTCGVIQNITLT